MSCRAHPFDEYIQQSAGGLRVVHAALLFALDRHSDLCIPTYLKRLDDLASRVDALRATTPREQTAALRQVLVEQEGLTGQTADFCDPCSSYINRVLDRRHGLPIALSAIWLDVANRLGWQFHGVGMPGHFLVSWSGPGQERCFVDPFGAGAVLDRAGCAALLARCFGQEMVLEDSHLAPVSERAMLSRMLGNLRSLYCAAQQWRCAERVLQRLLALHPGNAELVDEIGRVRRLACEQN
jgi:regulator of sirC expression with transglutaminase-like and TPR domain